MTNRLIRPLTLLVSNIRTRWELRAVRRAFDENFYRAQFPADTEFSSQPIDHYFEIGWKTGADPRQDFSTAYYLSANPDVAMSGMNAFYHYVVFGRKEGRPVAPVAEDKTRHRLPLLALSEEELDAIENAFDASFYSNTYPDVAASGMSAFEHYKQYGAEEGRQPRKDFSPYLYEISHPEMLETRLYPFAHQVLKNGFEKATSQTRNTLEIDESERALVRSFFDTDFYLKKYPDLRHATKIDPLTHFMVFGWRELRDPSPNFSTSFYLATNPDVRDAGINPFLHFVAHGRAERRDPVPYFETRVRQFKPLVSVIVPNYNHARFLPQRLESIVAQTYANIEIILLDDSSSDDSVSVLTAFAESTNIPVKTAFNVDNSGSVFSQWQKGLSLATGDLIWICESDDFCDVNFLEKLVSHFADRSVMLAFGRIEFCDENGQPMDGMSGFREQAEPGIWHEVVKRPARAWFSGPLSARNLISNVGGCLFRNQNIPEAVWRSAQEFRIAGDWYLYLYLSHGGRIVFEPSALAYFRQHGKNTSASNFTELYYFDEHRMMFEAINKKWRIDDVHKRSFIDNVRSQYDHLQMAAVHGSFESLFPEYESDIEPESRHILIAMLGFIPGGGEFFPIHLAGKMLDAGYEVSLFAYNMSDINEEMLNLVDSRISVYDAGSVRHRGVDRFVEEAGISLIHSHMVSCDNFFFNTESTPICVPYVVSLHGSHDSGGRKYPRWLTR